MSWHIQNLTSDLRLAVAWSMMLKPQVAISSHRMTSVSKWDHNQPDMEGRGPPQASRAPCVERKGGRTWMTIRMGNSITRRRSTPRHAETHSAWVGSKRKGWNVAIMSLSSTRRQSGGGAAEGFRAGWLTFGDRQTSGSPPDNGPKEDCSGGQKGSLVWTRAV